MDNGTTREAVLETYARPYARWLPIAYRGHHLEWVVGLAAMLAAFASILELVADDGAPDALWSLAVVVAAGALLRTALVTAGAARVIRQRTVQWREDQSELERVRRRRPHAADADARTAHAEYAVSVAEDGHLATWCFEPLAAYERPGPGEVLLNGTPRHAARPVARVPFEPVDAGRAAEQLGEAQADAARREAAAAERGRTGLDDTERARELMREAQGTGAALRTLTGQSSDG
jgi:hypothetical protein